VNEKTSRAKQFLPFATLKGYYDEIRERKRVIQPRRDRTDEEDILLSYQMNQIKKGMMIKVVYYAREAYETTEGLVTHIDLAFHTLSIVKTKISLNDIYVIQGDDLVEIE
jgi:hypothetical protein